MLSSCIRPPLVLLISCTRLITLSVVWAAQSAQLSTAIFAVISPTSLLIFISLSLLLINREVCCGATKAGVFWLLVHTQLCVCLSSCARVALPPDGFLEASAFGYRLRKSKANPAWWRLWCCWLLAVWEWDSQVSLYFYLCKPNWSGVLFYFSLDLCIPGHIWDFWGSYLELFTKESITVF